MNPIRISQDGGPVLTPGTPPAQPVGPVAPVTPAQPSTPAHDVPVWAKALIAAAIPMLGGVALIPGVSPTVAGVCALAALGVTGVAGFLGMATGSQRGGSGGAP